MGGWIGLIPQRAALAEKLAEITPEGPHALLLQSGGGEAIDTAIKFAKGRYRETKDCFDHQRLSWHTGLRPQRLREGPCTRNLSTL